MINQNIKNKTSRGVQTTIHFHSENTTVRKIFSILNSFHIPQYIVFHHHRQQMNQFGAKQIRLLVLATILQRSNPHWHFNMQAYFQKFMVFV